MATPLGGEGCRILVRSCRLYHLGKSSVKFGITTAGPTLPRKGWAGGAPTYRCCFSGEGVGEPLGGLRVCAQPP